MIHSVIVFTAYCVMFVVVVRAVIDPSFARVIGSMVTPADAICGLAVIACLAAWSNNGAAMRAFVGVVVLAVALIATTGGLTRIRRNSVGTGTGKAVPL